MDAPVVAVAYSGGRDSTALLHATVHEASEVGWCVVALHVHHGLSDQADHWLAHGRAQCRLWSEEGLPVAFEAERLAGGPPSGDSIEAWARRGRYEALGRMARAHGATVVLLGHHLRDQAETFVLQALRGGGVAGLAGMPERIERDGIVWLRPWLRRSREDIDAYVLRHRLSAVDDPSNADCRFARNRLRHGVWPALSGAFPGAEASLAQAAAWARDADAALAELVEIDLQAVTSDTGLDVAGWSALSSARRSLALRAWLKGRPGGVAPMALTIRLMEELPACAAGRWSTASGELRLHRGVLQLHEPPTEAASPPETWLGIPRAGMYALPGWGGRLQARRVAAGGVPIAWLSQLELKARQGGERFQAGLGRPPRSLKKQFQQAGIAAWERRGPLVYSGGRLVFVPGLGIDARALASPGEEALALDWFTADSPVDPARHDR